MNPSQASQDLFEAFMMRQWFVAGMLIVDIVFLVIAFIWLLKRQDKRDQELKEVVHNYYNATSTNSLAMQALATGINNTADELADLRRAVSKSK